MHKKNSYSYWHYSGRTGGFRTFVGFNKDRQQGVVNLFSTSEDLRAIGQSVLE
jgi:hypothetical protein